VADKAKEEPELYGKIAAEMNATGKIDPAAKNKTPGN